MYCTSFLNATRERHNSGGRSAAGVSRTQRYGPGSRTASLSRPKSALNTSRRPPSSLGPSISAAALFGASGSRPSSRASSHSDASMLGLSRQPSLDDNSQSQLELSGHNPHCQPANRPLTAGRRSLEEVASALSLPSIGAAGLPERPRTATSSVRAQLLDRKAARRSGRPRTASRPPERSFGATERSVSAASGYRQSGAGESMSGSMSTTARSQRLELQRLASLDDSLSWWGSTAALDPLYRMPNARRLALLRLALIAWRAPLLVRRSLKRHAMLRWAESTEWQHDYRRYAWFPLRVWEKEAKASARARRRGLELARAYCRAWHKAIFRLWAAGFRRRWTLNWLAKRGAYLLRQRDVARLFGEWKEWVGVRLRKRRRILENLMGRRDNALKRTALSALRLYAACKTLRYAREEKYGAELSKTYGYGIPPLSIRYHRSGLELEEVLDRASVDSEGEGLLEFWAQQQEKDRFTLSALQFAARRQLSEAMDVWADAPEDGRADFFRMKRLGRLVFKGLALYMQLEAERWDRMEAVLAEAGQQHGKDQALMAENIAAMQAALEARKRKKLKKNGKGKKGKGGGKKAKAKKKRKPKKAAGALENPLDFPEGLLAERPETPEESLIAEGWEKLLLSEGEGRLGPQSLPLEMSAMEPDIEQTELKLAALRLAQEQRELELSGLSDAKVEERGRRALLELTDDESFLPDGCAQPHTPEDSLLCAMAEQSSKMESKIEEFRRRRALLDGPPDGDLGRASAQRLAVHMLEPGAREFRLLLQSLYMLHAGHGEISLRPEYLAALEALAVPLKQRLTIFYGAVSVGQAAAAEARARALYLEAFLLLAQPLQLKNAARRWRNVLLRQAFDTVARYAALMRLLKNVASVRFSCSHAMFQRLRKAAFNSRVYRSYGLRKKVQFRKSLLAEWSYQLYEAAHAAREYSPRVMLARWLEYTQKRVLSAKLQALSVKLRVEQRKRACFNALKFGLKAQYHELAQATTRGFVERNLAADIDLWQQVLILQKGLRSEMLRQRTRRRRRVEMGLAHQWAQRQSRNRLFVMSQAVRARLKLEHKLSIEAFAAETIELLQEALRVSENSESNSFPTLSHTLAVAPGALMEHWPAVFARREAEVAKCVAQAHKLRETMRTKPASALAAAVAGGGEVEADELTAFLHTKCRSLAREQICFALVRSLLRARLTLLQLPELGSEKLTLWQAARLHSSLEAELV